MLFFVAVPEETGGVRHAAVGSSAARCGERANSFSSFAPSSSTLSFHSDALAGRYCDAEARDYLVQRRLAYEALWQVGAAPALQVHQRNLSTLLGRAKNVREVETTAQAALLRTGLAGDEHHTIAQQRHQRYNTRNDPTIP